MRQVTRFEAHLLRLLQHMLHEAPAAQLAALLETKIERPACLSRNALELIKDMLGKGCILLLVRRGAWHNARYLRDGRIAAGNLWQRTPPDQLGFGFSGCTLDFLMWLASSHAAEEKKHWQLPSVPALGDLLLFFFVLEKTRELEIGRSLSQSAPWTSHGLIWLARPEIHAATEDAPDFRPWLDGTGAAILEALQPYLAERWRQLELSKSQMTGWEQLRDLGRAQSRAVQAFLDAVEDAGRLDLARFVLQAAARVLPAGANAEMWVGGLRQQGPRLADRAETYAAALALLQALTRLQTWDRRARGVAWFDEGYQASQLWKADWEQYQGDVLTERAEDVIRQLDPLRQAGGSS